MSRRSLLSFTLPQQALVVLFLDTVKKKLGYHIVFEVLHCDCKENVTKLAHRDTAAGMYVSCNIIQKYTICFVRLHY